MKVEKLKASLKSTDGGQQMAVIYTSKALYSCGK